MVDGARLDLERLELSPRDEPTYTGLEQDDLPLGAGVPAAAEKTANLPLDGDRLTGGGGGSDGQQWAAAVLNRRRNMKSGNSGKLAIQIAWLGFRHSATILQ